MTKKMIPLIGSVLLLTSVSHADIQDKMITASKHSITNTAKVITKNKTTMTSLNNVKMEAKMNMKKSVALGDAGNNLQGEKIYAKNVRMVAKADMKDSLVAGNIGNSVGR
jgi:hypothetical protein